MAERFLTPKVLTGATSFWDDDQTGSASWLIATLQSPELRFVYDDLEAASRALEARHGRKRMPGSWVLAYLCFVISKQTDIHPWWKDDTDDAFWQSIGFQKKPGYPTVWERFTELEDPNKGRKAKDKEDIAERFNEAAAKLIQHARSHEPMIGYHVHIDSTEAETHAALVHDDEKCGPNCDRSKVPHLQRADTSHVRDKRHKAVEKAVEERPEEAETPAKTAADANAPLDIFNLEYGDIDERNLRTTDDGKLSIKVGKHWFKALDTTAGARYYSSSKRFWFGFYCAQVIDHVTGAPLSTSFFSASRNEADCYFEVYNQFVGILGDQPKTVTADKGYAYRSIYKHNTMLGIATITPYRETKGEADSVIVDRNGIPRCRHCKGPGTFHRFQLKGGYRGTQPRLYFKCARQCRKADGAEQSYYCKEDWLRLTPLWQNDPLYQELSSTHSEFERVHLAWRNRYRVAADTLAFRPKRRGIKWQQLRANGALLVEWLRINVRQGWIGGQVLNGHTTPRHAEKHAARMAAREKRVERRLKNWRDERKKKNLHLTYDRNGKPREARDEQTART